MNKLSSLFDKQFFRYILVGLANTFVTACFILFFTYLEFGLYEANLVGYIIGIMISYILNSVFTFSTTLSVLRSIKFLVTCIGCYIINIAMMNFSMLFISNIYLVQLAGMVAYTFSGFIINKFWVMK